MKKQLLLGSALLAAISAFPQNGRTQAQPTKMVDLAQKVARKYQATERPTETASPFQAPSSTAKTSLAANTTTASLTSTITVWNNFTGSENIYGMLVSNSKPIQYNDELGRISFIHRKSHTYNANPLPSATASTGVIVAEISNSWGQSWDSTVLWSNDTYWARYPQGGIYNPTGNTDPRNAYVVGSGPVTQAVVATGWVGDWFASRALDSAGHSGFNNNISGASMNFVTNGISPAPALTPGTFKIDFARLDFSATDDGVVRSLGTINNDPNNTTSGNLTSGYGYRGARIAKGTFSSANHNFTWTYDSIIPPVRTNTTTNSKEVFSSPHMAWNESGTIGYVWHIGSRVGATGNNIGYQPVVSKTTDGGATWTSIAGIDFNTPAMDNAVLKWIPSVKTNTALTIPLFNSSEDLDGIVDMNGKLHIVGTILGASKSHPDSLLYSYQFDNSNDNQTYSFGHTPGLRPYIFDFSGDGTGTWNAMMIDSMSSEAPGTASTDNGVSFNPWDVDPTTSTKVDVNARIQLSRTADGKYIVYTWAETDTATTSQSVKWNISPNVKARMLNVSTGVLHPTEINITDPDANQNASVRGYAFNHYVSPKCAVSTNSASGIAIFLPMSVSNNPSLFQLEPVTHYYSSAVLNFDNIPAVQPPYAVDYRNGQYVGIAENALNSTRNSVIYPNPAKGSAVLSIDLKDNASKIEVSVMNMVGQQVKSSQTSSQIGQNNINVDLNGLSQGIYMVNVKVGGAISTKKLVVE